MKIEKARSTIASYPGGGNRDDPRGSLQAFTTKPLWDAFRDRNVIPTKAVRITFTNAATGLG
jgi:hypothetical protein